MIKFYLQQVQVYMKYTYLRLYKVKKLIGLIKHKLL